MYNKLFTKILDSSVWLENASTRLVWLTLIASMDEDGFCAFAAVGNLANRARVPLAACDAALKTLESPDLESADPEHEGRRIQRVPGGWVVLNAAKYREMVTRVVVREQTRQRVRRFREKQRNADVTQQSLNVTPSDTDTDTEDQDHCATTFAEFWEAYPRKVGKVVAEKAWRKLAPTAELRQIIHDALETHKRGPQWTKDQGQFIPHPATWLNQRRWEDETESLMSDHEFFRIHGYKRQREEDTP